MHPDRHPLRSPFLARGKSHPDEAWALGPGERLHGTGARSRRASLEIIEAGEGHLADLGLERGTLIGLRSAQGPGFVEALVAAWGQELCPVLLDPTIAATERAQLNQRLGIGWDWDLEDGWSEDLGCALRNAESTPENDTRMPGAAVLKLTSGTTGPARGIAIPAAALAADTQRLAGVMDFRSDDRLLVAVPMSHSYGFSVLVAPALLFASTLCFAGDLDVLEAARQMQATFLPSVPSWYRAALPLTNTGDLPESLRLFLSAGAPLAPETARAFREKFGRPICILYGASECGGIAYDATGTATERGSVGLILPGVQVELGQAEQGGGRPVSVISDAVAQSYVPVQGEDAQHLDGVSYRSEDLARVESGELFLMGRTSDWINVRAKKVNPREVEAVIGDLDGVEEVFVHGASIGARGGQDTSHGEEVIRAMVASPGGTVTVRMIRDWCATRLAPHKRPRAIVILEALPHTGRGKLDRGKLRAMNSASAPETRAVGDS